MSHDFPTASLDNTQSAILNASQTDLQIRQIRAEPRPQLLESFCPLLSKDTLTHWDHAKGQSILQYRHVENPNTEPTLSVKDAT